MVSKQFLVATKSYIMHNICYSVLLLKALFTMEKETKHMCTGIYIPSVIMVTEQKAAEVFKLNSKKMFFGGGGNQFLFFFCQKV